MPVRKTESRIPANFQASDLGEAVVAADGRCALVSFITSPLAANRENVYVLFVTDSGLAASAHSFEWTFTDSVGTSTSVIIEDGEISYSPQSLGSLNVTVRIIDTGHAQRASLTLAQEVTSLNTDLEAIIADASNEPGPGVSNPETARELVNDHSPYYQTVTLQTPEAGDGFERFLFGMVFDGALERTLAQRKQHLDKLAQSLNGGTNDFVTQSAQGVGVSSIRLVLLAMTVPLAPSHDPLLPWTELPEPTSQRAVADEQLRESLASLDETVRIDLFNIVRFPKSNITCCARILETLRNHYFRDTNFNDVLTGMSGTRAHWLIRHYREGPLLKS